MKGKNLGKIKNKKNKREAAEHNCREKESIFCSITILTAQKAAMHELWRKQHLRRALIPHQ